MIHRDEGIQPLPGDVRIRDGRVERFDLERGWLDYPGGQWILAAEALRRALLQAAEDDPTGFEDFAEEFEEGARRLMEGGL